MLFYQLIPHLSTTQQQHHLERTSCILSFVHLEWRVVMLCRAAVCYRMLASASSCNQQLHTHAHTHTYTHLTLAGCLTLLGSSR